MPESISLCEDRDILISLNERFSSLARKLDEFILTMRESYSEMREDNIRRDETYRTELSEIKHQHAEDMATCRREYTELVTALRKDHKDEVKSLNETVLMLKGAIALVYLIAAIFSIWNKFGG